MRNQHNQSQSPLHPQWTPTIVSRHNHCRWQTLRAIISSLIHKGWRELRHVAGIEVAIVFANLENLSLRIPLPWPALPLCLPVFLSIFIIFSCFPSFFSRFWLTATHDSDSRYMSAEEQSRELTRSIRREVGKLSEQWNNLIDRSDNWKHRLDEYMTVSLAQRHDLTLLTYSFICSVTFS